MKLVYAQLFVPIYSLVVIASLLVSCAKISQPYPPSFNQLLYSHSSMTRQLKCLGTMQVSILYAKMEDNNFRRISSLNVENKPVVVAMAVANRASPYFVKMLENAGTTPLGKVLFATDSKIAREPTMEVEPLYLDDIDSYTIRNYIASLAYTKHDIFYKRTSVFRKGKQYMQLIEYILPSLSRKVQLRKRDCAI